MANQTPTILYDRRVGIAFITLDRPQVNVIDTVMTLEYFAALERADNDHEARVIVLSGKGKGLSAGADIRMLENFGQAEMKEFVDLFYVEGVERVRALSKPIIASVHGYAREGACTLAFACDMIIASDDATFGYPGVPHLAAPPGMHVWHLQRLLGRFKAAELVYTGDPMGAVEADRRGLITKVVPRDELQAATEALAQRIAAMSPLALRTARSLIFEMEDLPFEKVPTRAAQAISEAFASEDSKEARRAFIEKREPVWSGR